MRVARTVAFVPIVACVWAVVDAILQAAYTFTPAGTRIISGSFQVGQYRFDVALLAILVVWAIICLVWLFAGIYQLLIRGVSLSRVMRLI